jgi:hypothetical protein
MDLATSFVYNVLKVAVATTPVHVDATATYQFNPSMSQEEACKRAEDKAKTQALQKVLGQDFGSDSTMSCRESDTYKCESVKNMYENTRGYIRSITSRNEKVNGWNCTVDISVKVQEFKKRTPTIQSQATLDRVVYTAQDTINLNVSTTDKGYVIVYKYDPIDNQVTKIFPNENTKTSTWTYSNRPLKVTIPANSFPEREVPYYMFVTVAGGITPTLSNYRLHEFYDMWDNQPYDDITFIRKSFYVSRSKL